MRKLTWLVVALCSFLAGGGLALQHPLWPTATTLLFCTWCLCVAWRPSIWLFGVPALLPLLNFSPWTGWLMVEEFDILLLATLAGGYINFASGDGRFGFAAKGLRFAVGWFVVSAVAGLLGLYRGLVDAGSFSMSWFGGYADASNSFRVFKSLGFALLLAPLLSLELRRDQTLACRHFAVGMVTGLTVMALAALWERAAFPGVFDFSTHYRTVALFWEMHVGGAAIDVYLAISTPFAVWALLEARRPVIWLGAAILTLLVVYVALTTFARGVYLAVAVPALMLGLSLWTQKYGAATQRFLGWIKWRSWFFSWRAKSGALLSIALVIEVVAVLGGGNFMAERLANTRQDLGSRLVHWRHGLSLLQTPADLLLGFGYGRLPARYAASVPGGEFSGDVTLTTEPLRDQAAKAFVTVHGPKTQRVLGGAYELTQRVGQVLPGLPQVGLNIRVWGDTSIEIYLCERHLLYDRTCQSAFLSLKPVYANGVAVWQSFKVVLRGQQLKNGWWFAPRLMMFSLAVVTAGAHADFDNVTLTGADGISVLKNGGFSSDLAHWFPAAQSYFEPWHLDNLYLEVLVERGILGLALFIPAIYVWWQLVLGRAKREPLAIYVAAALTGTLLVGLVSSVMDVPRVAFLLYLLISLGTLIATQEDLQKRSTS